MNSILAAILILCLVGLLGATLYYKYYVLVLPAYYATFPAFDYERDVRVVVEATNATLAGFDQAERTIHVKPDGNAYIINYGVVVPEGFRALLHSRRDTDINVYSVEKACALSTGDIDIKDGKLVVYVYRTGECPPTVIVEIKAIAVLQKGGATIGTYTIHDVFAIKELEHADTAHSSLTVTPLSLSYEPRVPAHMLPFIIIATIILTIILVIGIIVALAMFL